MPYIQNDSHIVSPVSISDVKQCFGSGIIDLATLCMLNNINWKSVNKPVYMNKMEYCQVPTLQMEGQLP